MDKVPTIAEVLERLPSDIAAEFDCTRGPHRWVKGLAGRYDFCLDCPKVRRLPWPDTRPLYNGVPVGFWQW